MAHIKIWEDWKETDNKDSLNELFKKYNGMIQSSVNRYVNPNIPRVVLEGEAKNQVFKAFQTFDPKRGTKLSTHIGTRLKKLYSFTSKYQNIGKIPEGDISSINIYKKAKIDLATKYGREPSTTELADYLTWNIKRVSKMEASLRGDYSAVNELENMEVYSSNPALEKMKLSYYDMTPQEQTVFDYTLGMHGKQKLSPGQISDKMNISNSKVSVIKNKISQRLAQYG